MASELNCNYNQKQPPWRAFRGTVTINHHYGSTGPGFFRGWPLCTALQVSKVELRLRRGLTITPSLWGCWTKGGCWVFLSEGANQSSEGWLKPHLRIGLEPSPKQDCLVDIPCCQWPTMSLVMIYHSEQIMINHHQLVIKIANQRFYNQRHYNIVWPASMKDCDSLVIEHDFILNNFFRIVFRPQELLWQPRPIRSLNVAASALELEHQRLSCSATLSPSMWEIIQSITGTNEFLQNKATMEHFLHQRFQL